MRFIERCVESTKRGASWVEFWNLLELFMNS
jgi:hypothetical protein